MPRYPTPRPYRPRHPEKYKGDPTTITMRSSWETRFAYYCDYTQNVIAWGSETIVVPYTSPIDGNVHRYFVDFWVKVKDSIGDVTTYLVEIKPNVQCKPPKGVRGRRTRERVLEETKTYAINQAKWAAATEYAKRRGWRFIVLDENALGIK